MKEKIYRKYERMTEDEQKATGFPTDRECSNRGLAPPSVILGYDPFLKAVDKTWDELTEEERNKLT